MTPCTLSCWQALITLCGHDGVMQRVGKAQATRSSTTILHMGGA